MRLATLPALLVLTACAQLPPVQPRPPGGYAALQFLETVSLTRFYEIPPGTTLVANRGPDTFCGNILGTPAIGSPNSQFFCFKLSGDTLVQPESGWKATLAPSAYRHTTI